MYKNAVVSYSLFASNPFYYVGREGAGVGGDDATPSPGVNAISRLTMSGSWGNWQNTPIFSSYR